MERLLLLWDELDDLAGACRHVAASAADEVASLAAPLSAVGSVLATGLISLNWQAHRLLTSAVISMHWMF